MHTRMHRIRAVSPHTDCVIRPFLLLVAAAALFAFPAPAPAQSSASDVPVARTQTITPGGGRAQRRLRSAVASYYHASLHGRKTASGERYNHSAMTVAHKTLPFGTLLRITDRRSGRRVLARVNDRGPFIRGRELDLSGAAADRLRMRSRGTARVSFEIVDPSTLPSRTPPPPRKVRHL